MRITILGKRWDLRFVNRVPKGNVGDADHPTAKGKIIRIQRGMEEKLELDTLIHEMLHCADCHKKEDWVNIVATDIAEVLWKLGWRKPGSGN